MPDDLLGTLQPPTTQSVMGQYGTAGQIGVGLAGLGQQTNPFLAQEQERFKQQVELMRLRQSIQKQRMEEKKLLLSMAKDLPDDDPASVRKKLEIYNKSGLLTYSPEEITSAEGIARSKQRVSQLPQVIGGIRAGLSDQDLETFYSGIGKNFNLPQLRQMTPDQLEALGGPETVKQFALATEASLKAKAAKLHADAVEALKAESEGRGHATPFQRSVAGLGPKTPDELAGMLAMERATNPQRVFTPTEQTLLKQFDIEKRVKGETGLARLSMLCALGDQDSCRGLRVAKTYDLNALKVSLSEEVAKIALKEQRGLPLTDDEKRTQLQWNALTRDLKGPKPLPSTLRTALTQAKETVASIYTIEDILARHPEYKKKFGVIRGNSALFTFRWLGLNDQELTDLISATKNLFLAGGKQQFGARFTQSEMRLLNLAKPSLDQPLETFMANLKTWKHTALPKYHALMKEGRGLGADLDEYEIEPRSSDPSLDNPATRRALELLTPKR